MRRYKHILLAAALAITPALAHATGILDQFQNDFASAAPTWFSKAQGYANDVFYSLALIDVLWMALTWVLTRKTFDEILPHFMRKVMVFGFFLALIANAGTWLPDIMNSFADVGSATGGVPTLTPSTLVDTGTALSYGMLTGDYAKIQSLVPGATVPQAPTAATTNSTTTCNWYALCLNQVGNAVADTVTSALSKLEFFIIMLILAVVTWVSFLMIAIDLLITTIEAYIVAGIGVFFLGFGGSRWTTKFADGVLNYAVSVGVKLMMLYLVIGIVVTSFVPQIVSALMISVSSNTGMLPTALTGAAGLIIMLVLSKAIPSKAQSLLGGGAALGAAHAVQAATNAGSALVGGGRSIGGAAAGVAGVAGGVAGLALAGAKMAFGSTGGVSAGSAPGVAAMAAGPAGAAVAAAGSAVAGTAASGAAAPAAGSALTAAPAAQQAPRGAPAQNSGMARNLSNTAQNLAAHPGGSVSANHISTGHGD